MEIFLKIRRFFLGHGFVLFLVALTLALAPLISARAVDCEVSPDGTPCDDGNACTPVDTCIDEECIGSGQLDCSGTTPDGNPCHDTGCDPTLGCIDFAPKLDMACNHILVYASRGFPNGGGGLFLADRDTGYRTPISNQGGEAFAVEADGSILIASGSQIKRIDPVTKTASLVTTMTGCSGVQIYRFVIESPDSLVFVAVSSGLYRLDLNNGACTPMQNFSGAGSSFGGVAMEAPGSYLVVAADGPPNPPPQFGRIDPGRLLRATCDPNPDNPPNCGFTVVSDFNDPAQGPVYVASDPWGLALENSTTALVTDLNGGFNFEGTVSRVDLTSGVRTTIAAWSEFPYGALPLAVTFPDSLGFIWTSTDQSSPYCDPNIFYSGCPLPPITCPRDPFDPFLQCTYTYSGEVDKIHAVDLTRTLVSDLGDPADGQGRGDGLNVAVYCDRSPAACDATSCDDGNPCTDDGCNPGSCCTHIPNSDACDDGDPCTTGDFCQGGVCTGGSPVVCTALDQCHLPGTCTNGVCDNPLAPDGYSCSDGNACTVGDSCQSGTCIAGPPVTCTASDQCHDPGTCDPATGLCSNPAKPNGSACSDANLCTQTDTCQAGACTGANPVSCTASDQCHDAGTCNPGTGTCDNPTKPDGSACNDANPCTQADTCQSGACAGGNPVTCSASDSCHDIGTCDPGTGVCDNPVKPDGSACDDGNPCTSDDICTGGVCSGGSSSLCAGEGFELDGNILLDDPNRVDWRDIFDAAGQVVDPLPTGFGPALYTPDSSQPDANAFVIGTKDDQDIPTWNCVETNLPPKNDLKNAYATIYLDPNSGHQVLYFAAELAGGTSPANASFWYLQDGTVSCSSATGFIGEHTQGDLLVQLGFSFTGQVEALRVYQWDPNAIDNLLLITEADIFGTSGLLCTPDNIACAASADPSDFFEAGVDLDAANLGSLCFNKFLAATRTSSGPTADLVDFTLASLPSCQAPAVCGNGTVESGEDCDDGNTVGGDCCDATCQLETPPAGDATCDGMDDDCDGATDEDFASTATSCGTGACASNGATSCVNGAVVDSCSPGTPAANDAACNGIDDDCNGAADEDFVPTPTNCGIGACASTGATSCVGGSLQDSCAPGTPAASDTLCNGIDDDCDGPIDEEFAPQLTNCGIGACAATGHAFCVNGSVVDFCTPGIPAPADLHCDGIDDDCDGSTDEEYTPIISCFLPGACAAGNTPSSCGANGHETPCQPGSPSGTSETLCNGIDDDCDGLSDEDYTSDTSCFLPGACEAGNVESSCVAGVETACEAGTPVAETCDGIDNDCDGEVDNANSGGALHQPPSSTLCPICGDGICGPNETCEDDCGATVCGDARCDQDEDCPDDCGNACAAACGDGTCTAPEEDGSTCPDDCGGMVCGDARCEEGEDCPDDCGSCGPVAVCGNGSVESGEGCDDGNTVGGDCCDAACQVEADGSACEDGDFCTVGDACQGGLCAPGSPDSCDDGSVCTTDSCDPGFGCSNTPISCDDAVSCTADSCDALLGCQHVPNSSACPDDTFSCTMPECDAILGCRLMPNHSFCVGVTGSAKAKCQPNKRGRNPITGCVTK